MLTLFVLMIMTLTFADNAQLFSLRSQQMYSNRLKQHTLSNNNLPEVHFPSYNDTLEMAGLSVLAYEVRHNPDPSSVCSDVHQFDLKNVTSWLAPDLMCHWYHHDLTTSTQVLIVSSYQRNYLAITFAGTDDLKTSLTDMEVLMTPFASHDEDNDHLDLPQQNSSAAVRIHEGFDRAVFSNHMYHNISNKVRSILAKPVNQNLRVFTTGHSLGAANAILTAVALNVEFNNTRSQNRSLRRPGSQSLRLASKPITCINFGCPQIGNSFWRDFVNQKILILKDETKGHYGRFSDWFPFPFHSKSDSDWMQLLGIWRFVLGWDLVPRLPEFMYHVGHTIQLVVDTTAITNTTVLAATITPKNGTARTTIRATTTSTIQTNTAAATARAYYQHYGDADLKFAGVPFGWSAKAFWWLPGALGSHRMRLYWKVIQEWRADDWVHDFEKVNDTDHRNNSNINTDDDTSNEWRQDDVPYVDDEWIEPSNNTSILFQNEESRKVTIL